MRFQFLLGEIGNGLRRNLSMAVSVVIVTMISMYLLGLGLMGQRQVDTMKDYWYDRVQVTVLLCAEKTRFANCAGEPTTDAQRTAIKAELEALKPTVKEVYYESRDQAFDRFSRAETSRTTPGSGLGLSLVMAVATVHGGTARIDPGVAGGRVELRVPQHVAARTP